MSGTETKHRITARFFNVAAQIKQPNAQFYKRHNAAFGKARNAKVLARFTRIAFYWPSYPPKLGDAIVLVTKALVNLNVLCYSSSLSEYMDMGTLLAVVYGYRGKPQLSRRFAADYY